MYIQAWRSHFYARSIFGPCRQQRERLKEKRHDHWLEQKHNALLVSVVDTDPDQDLGECQGWNLQVLSSLKPDLDPNPNTLKAGSVCI